MRVSFNSVRTLLLFMSFVTICPYLIFRCLPLRRTLESPLRSTLTSQTFVSSLAYQFWLLFSFLLPDQLLQKRISVLSLVLSTCIDSAFLVHPLPLQRFLRQACIRDKQPTSSLSSVLFFTLFTLRCIRVLPSNLLLQTTYLLYFIKERTDLHPHFHVQSGYYRKLHIIGPLSTIIILILEYFLSVVENYFSIILFTTLSMCLFVLFFYHYSLIGCIAICPQKWQLASHFTASTIIFQVIRFHYRTVSTVSIDIHFLPSIFELFCSTVR